jgi:hypothetical protein
MPHSHRRVTDAGGDARSAAMNKVRQKLAAGEVTALLEKAIARVLKAGKTARLRAREPEARGRLSFGN